MQNQLALEGYPCNKYVHQKRLTTSCIGPVHSDRSTNIFVQVEYTEVDEKLARLTDDELSDSEILKNNGVEIVERQNSRQSVKDVPAENNDDDDDEEDDDDLPTGM